MRKTPDPGADPRLLAELAHELRTPLNAVIGFADAMRGRAFGPLDERYVACAQAIHEAGLHLLGLIDDMTRRAGAETVRRARAFERFDIRTLIEETVRLLAVLAEQAGVTLRADLSADPLEIVADQRAVRQILINLLANALKATPAGGAVTVQVQGRGDDLLLTVKDTGMGLATTNRSVAAEGIGLGLVRAFCELHQGSLTMASPPGHGAIATVRLPVIAKR